MLKKISSFEFFFAFYIITLIYFRLLMNWKLQRKIKQMMMPILPAVWGII